MLRSLSLLLVALAVGACGDASPAESAVGDAASTAGMGASALSANPDSALTDPALIDPALTEPAEMEASAETAATPAAASSTPMVEVTVMVNVDHAESGAETLTLRGGPSTSAANLGTFRDGNVIECQDLKRDDAWCRLRAGMGDGGPIGWAKRRHLSYVGNIMEESDGVRMLGNMDLWDTPEGFSLDTRLDILADDGYANVRATPDADGALVRRLDNRTMTTVARCAPGPPGRRWCRISAPVSGWVHQSGFHPELRDI